MGEGKATGDRLGETLCPPQTQFQVGHAGGMTDLKLACGRGLRSKKWESIAPSLTPIENPMRIRG
jgi:hypothetical protein